MNRLLCFILLFSCFPFAIICSLHHWYEQHHNYHVFLSRTPEHQFCVSKGGNKTILERNSLHSTKSDSREATGPTTIDAKTTSGTTGISATSETTRTTKPILKTSHENGRISRGDEQRAPSSQHQEHLQEHQSSSSLLHRTQIVTSSDNFCSNPSVNQSPYHSRNPSCTTCRTPSSRTDKSDPCLVCYDSDDEMVRRDRRVSASGHHRSKKGRPIYSREDIREQYCINSKELKVFEESGAYTSSRLFGCLSMTHLPDHSPCITKTSFLSKCVKRSKHTTLLDSKRRRWVRNSSHLFLAKHTL